MASKIEDYGLIGNTRTAALVSRSGSIDWLCTPRFDSDACFSSLVGYDEHGRWALRPTVAVRESKQRYRGDTMILETEFVCDGGAVRIVDFMPVPASTDVRDDRCDVVRIVEGLDGEVPIEMLIDLRFGYGQDTPWVTAAEGGVRFTAGPDTVVVRAPIQLQTKDTRVSAYLTVRKGDRIPLQLNWHASYQPTPAALGAD